MVIRSGEDRDDEARGPVDEGPGEAFLRPREPASGEGTRRGHPGTEDLRGGRTADEPTPAPCEPHPASARTGGTRPARGPGAPRDAISADEPRRGRRRGTRRRPRGPPDRAPRPRQPLPELSPLGREALRPERGGRAVDRIGTRPVPVGRRGLVSAPDRARRPGTHRAPVRRWDPR